MLFALPYNHQNSSGIQYPTLIIVGVLGVHVEGEV